MCRSEGTSNKVTNFENWLYYGMVNIGTPPQVFTCHIDTGSTMIWVVQTGCQDCHKCNNTFTPSKSSTFSTEFYPYNLTYLKGKTIGYIAYDTLSLGDASINVTDQPFVLAIGEEDDDGYASDGLIGFAFDSLEPGYPSFMTQLYIQGEIKHRTFALYLNKEGGDISSNLMIDGYDLKKYSKDKDFLYLNIYQQSGFWNLLNTQFSFGNTILATYIPAVLDSGTSWIYAPEEIYESILDEFIGSSSCEMISKQIQCLCDKKYPDFSWILNGHTFNISSESYFSKKQKIDGVNLCQFLLGKGSEDAWLLGDVFMRNFYINHDMDNLRIGIAEARHSDNALRWIFEGWKLILILIIAS
ncbi:PGC_1 [Blepharisma stoltei]|uniref:Peptidase A1 domain-containing protein n=1 Tax=Blepharisma stoltei TaxID=1481888 RepID=A0AAU9IFN1_9CILI|nr:unnamed protein product [Blepharisma stoltei]